MIKRKLSIRYSKDKNELLKAMRGVSFEDVEEEIESGRAIRQAEHPNKEKYPHQRIFIIRIRGYIYVVPFVFDKAKGEIFLKTIYPNRILNKRYEKR